MDRDIMGRYERVLDDRLERLGGRYAQILELDGFEFLVDPLLLWKPPRVLVRRGHRTVEVWLSEDNVSPCRPGQLTTFEKRRALALVRDHLDELRSGWFRLREDERRGRLRRNLLVY